MSNITLNIVEPSSPTPINPVDPGTGTVVPDTGLFTSGIGGAEAAIIATVSLVVILAIVGAIIYHKKKAGKQSNTASLLAKCKQAFEIKKHVSGLAILALLVSIGTVAGLLKLGVNAIDSEEADNIEVQDSTALTVTAESEELTIELADEPVFAVLPVDITVAEATEAGYTLTAYADSTDLVSTTDPDNTIPMIVVEGDGLSALTDNTYGLALGNEPTSKDEAVYTALSIDSEEPTIIKSMPEYTPTEENDTTTIYYGFYITPDMPYGTYTGASVNYEANINYTTVTFNGNDLYFNEDETQTTNEATYIAVPQEESEGTINQIISGEYLVPSQALPYRFLGWSTDPEATVPTYETEEKIAEFLPISPNTPITLYAVWQKATTITFSGNGADSGAMDTQTIIAGKSDSLYENAFVKDGYNFTGWNTVAEPTEQEPGETYADQAGYTAPAASQYLTLYAQWEKDITISDLTYMQDFASLSEADKTSVLNSMISDEQYQLKDNRDQKDYYISKLADGNVWMTQNLDFDIVAGGADLDSTNTDVPANWADAGNLTNTYATGATTWNSSYTAPESYDPGDFYWNGALIYNRETCTSNGGTWYSDYQSAYCYNYNITTSTGNAHYHLGNYYNWTAAVAMSYSSSYTSQYTDVNQSICPAGWRLPTYEGDKSYQNLVDTLSLSAGTSGNIQNDPVYFVYGGHKSDGGSIQYTGNFIRYWFGIVENSISSYELFARIYTGGSGNLNPKSNNSRSLGFSLRCVAR